MGLKHWNALYKGVLVFFFGKQKTAYEMLRSLVGSEMCIRDRGNTGPWNKWCKEREAEARRQEF